MSNAISKLETLKVGFYRSRQELHKEIESLGFSINYETDMDLVVIEDAHPDDEEYTICLYGTERCFQVCDVKINECEW